MFTNSIEKRIKFFKTALCFFWNSLLFRKGCAAELIKHFVTEVNDYSLL